jgi:hypothetical protein
MTVLLLIDGVWKETKWDSGYGDRDDLKSNLDAFRNADNSMWMGMVALAVENSKDCDVEVETREADVILSVDDVFPELKSEVARNE